MGAENSGLSFANPKALGQIENLAQTGFRTTLDASYWALSSLQSIQLLRRNLCLIHCSLCCSVLPLSGSQLICV